MRTPISLALAPADAEAVGTAPLRRAVRERAEAALMLRAMGRDEEARRDQEEGSRRAMEQIFPR
ncbi:MAG: hypothetical protein AUJ52_13095 [Elusimicrobia bacterium CG1_02_63_36]|nr:MAG: hypothetical protein AUJ52_13095 [Elusimicrobia bacterium CG1_02_63_36]PIP85086.1 MAG: hypothetical protein COR54_00625 [Elusimicrobia bacterium CG22_combo_CG10-13_8_21_14_all_63_91]PJA11895.1 MAG: hypothetical protein COX66_18590 [Elusimicrobia bacterium CG_4_10_14_0_2_um_filter_63_34]PJB24801.1 MAG: hypothetical protein CO113_11860 [Elusimicrobia bacterium CG_4_9_14_3_um_filter_62_55]